MENIPPFNAGAVAAVGGLRSQPENRRRIVGQDITAMEQNQMQFHSNGHANEHRHFKEQPVVNGHSVSSCFKSIDIVLYNCTGYVHVHAYQYMHIEFVFLIYPLLSRRFFIRFKQLQRRKRMSRIGWIFLKFRGFSITVNTTPAGYSRRSS